MASPHSLAASLGRAGGWCAALLLLGLCPARADSETAVPDPVPAQGLAPPLDSPGRTALAPVRAKKAKPRPAPRSGRAQVLTGVGLAVPSQPEGGRHLAAYVPVELELSLQVSGPLSVLLGGSGFAATFVAADCLGSAGRRPSALAAFGGVRLDPLLGGRGLVSPWLALRAGLVGQDGVSTADPCVERLVLSPYFGPRVGLDLRLGRTALTAAVGYDHLPRAPALTVQLGLSLRIF